MIVTKEWLNQWCDLEDISSDKICETLNSIGLEVDRVESINIPKKVVVGKVLSCSKHQEADKLSVCKVDIGSEVLQIVCGAKNVAKDQFVAVATIGAILEDNFKIKEAKLRGVDSFGMICSSSEIGLPTINDGIMILDESIGELKLGKELCEYPLLNDTIIEIELTANRGDCLSIYGVSRDLSALLKRELKRPNLEFNEDRRGVARVLKLHCDSGISSSIKLRFLDSFDASLKLLHQLRLAFIQKEAKSDILGYLEYVTHSTGVIMRAYDFDKITSDKDEPIVLNLEKDKDSLEVLSYKDKVLSRIGLNQNSEFLPDNNSQKLIIECSYIDPKTISLKQFQTKCKTDDSFYRASRGSEYELSLAMYYFCSLIDSSNVQIYSSAQNHIVPKEPLKLKIDLEFFEKFIGQKIADNEILDIFKRLGFGVKNMVVSVPLFRHDIQNEQDLVEEVVRIYGIDHIKSKPLKFYEKNRLNSSYNDYKKSIYYKQKAVGMGYFESIHYCFDDRVMMKKYNLTLVKDEYDIKNPITNELNTLRTSLLLHLLKSASNNKKLGKKRVKLFELGVVFDENRKESKRLSFIFSGDLNEASLKNSAKSKEVGFLDFAEDICSIIGDIELKVFDNRSSLLSSYECAKVILDSKEIGVIGRVHAEIERDFSLSNTYICELEYDKLPYELKVVKNYSKFPSLTRDISILTPVDLRFKLIKDSLEKILPKEVIEFFPIDIYESDELNNKRSLTIRFVLQSFEKTLNESEIVSIMDSVITHLKTDLNIELR